MLEWLILLAPFVGAVAAYFRRLYKLMPLFPLISFAAALFSLSLFESFRWLPFAGFGFWIDGMSLLFILVTSAVASLVLWYSLSYMAGEAGLRRFYALMLLFTGCMIGFVISTDLLQAFIFWELLSLCSYFLISFRYREVRARRAAVQAFIITKIGDVALLAAILLLFLQVGSFSIQTILAASIPSGILATVGLLIVIAVFAKCAQFPFHIWLPDAMAAPTPVSALLHSATLVQAGIFLLARLSPLFSDLPSWHYVAYAAAGSAVLMSLLAIGSRDIKRILAYSTSSQIGFMLVAVVSSPLGIAVALYLLISHAFFKSLLFLTAGAATRQTGEKDIRKLAGMAKGMPLTAALFTFGAFTLAGFPPLAGFWSKELLLEVLRDPSLKLLIDIGFVLTIVYAIRPVFYFYFKQPHRRLAEVSYHLWMPAAALLTLTFATIAFPIFITALIGIVVPVKLVPTPFLLIPIGLLAFWGYYRYIPEYGKAELHFVAAKLGPFYDRVTFAAVDSVSKALAAKERIWDRFHTACIAIIRRGPGKGLGVIIDYLQKLNPVSSREALIIAILGLLILGVLLL